MKTKILVISLPTSERRKSVNIEMSKLNINYDFIDAEYGDKFYSENTSLIDTEFCKNNFNHNFSLGEIGCAASHIKCYKYIIDNNIDRCLILEDDFIFEKDTGVVIDYLFTSKVAFDLAYLFHGKAKKWPFIKRKITGKFKFVKYIAPSKKSKRGIISTLGYIVTNKAAKKLLDMAYPIRMPSDYLTGFIQHNKLSTYGVEPNCISTGNSPSEIDNIEKRTYGAHI